MKCPSRIISLMVILCLLLVMDVCGAIEPEWSYKTGSWVESVAISSDGCYVVARSDDNKVYLFDNAKPIHQAEKIISKSKSIGVKPIKSRRNFKPSQRRVLKGKMERR